jgi:adenylate cyclase
MVTMRLLCISIFVGISLSLLPAQTGNPTFSSNELSLSQILQHLALIQENVHHKHVSDDSLKRMFFQALVAEEMSIEKRDTTAWVQALDFQRWYFRDQRKWEKARQVREQLANIEISYGYTLTPLHTKKDGNVPRRELLNELAVWRDSTAQYSLTEVLDSARQAAFSPLSTLQLNEDSSEQWKGAFWIRVRLDNPAELGTYFTFHPGKDASRWQWVDAHLLHEGKVQHQQTGWGTAESDREVAGSPGYFRFALPAKSQALLFVRVEGLSSRASLANLRLTHLNYEAFLHNRSREMHLNGIFQGVIVIQLIFFLLLFLTTKDRVHGYYSLYVAGLCLFIITANYLLNDLQSLRISAYVPYLLSIWISGYGLMHFAATYLNLEKRLPQWKSPMKVFLTIFSTINGSLFVLLLFRDSLHKIVGLVPFSILLVILGGVLFIIIFGGLGFIIFLGIQAFRAGFKPAASFLLASFFLLAGLILPGLLVLIGEINPNLSFLQPTYLISILQGGIALQLSCFALGLGQKHNLLEKSRKDALRENLEIQRRINAATERFVPYEFLSSLGKESILDVRLGDQVEKEVSVFFTDIRDYTTISEPMTPKENFSFLNSYLGRVGPIIKANRGFVNQYYGDGVMALFMVSKGNSCSPQDSVEAAIQMQHTLYQYNEERKAKQRLPIRIGIGIHTGPLMLGVIGDEKRMDVSVVSDTVNTASRMEGLTKHYGASILVSESTLLGIQDLSKFQYRFLGLALVKGKTDPIGVYDFFDGDLPEMTEKKAESLPWFETGLTHYFSKEFPLALQAFEEVLRIHPEDPVARLYQHRSQNLIEQGMPTGWTGVETWLSK